MSGYKPKSFRPVEKEPETQLYRPPSFQPLPEDEPQQRPRHTLSAAPKDGFVGPVETYFGQTADMIPLGRPLVNLAQTGGMQVAKMLGVGESDVKFTPEALEEMKALGIGVEDREVIPGALDTYRQSRDIRDARVQVGGDNHPTAKALGTATGLGASVAVPLPKALGGSAFGKQVVKASAKGGEGLPALMAGGGAMGAAQSAGDSRADLTRGEVGEFAGDVAIGLGAGVAAPVVGWGASNKLPELLRAFQQSGRKFALGQARRHMLDGAYSLSKKTVSDDVAEEAIRSGIRPFSSVLGTRDRLGLAVEQYGDVYANIVEQLEAAGIKGPDALDLADQLVKRGRELAPNTMNDATVGTWSKHADKVLDKVPSVEGAMGGRFFDPSETRLGLTQAENLKRSLQEMAKYGRVEETPINRELRGIASTFRQANEDAIETQAREMGGEVAEIADTFVPVKQKLGRLLGAQEATIAGAQKYENRPSIGLRELVQPSAARAAATKVYTALGPSTMASGAYAGSRVAGAGARAATLGNAHGMRAGAARAAAAGARGALEPEVDPKEARQWAEALPQIVQTQPELLGRYGPVFAEELRRSGVEGVQALDYALSLEDPAYAAAKREAMRRLTEGDSN